MAPDRRPGGRAARPRLSLVVDREATRHPLAAAVEAAVRAGVDQVQLRDRPRASPPLEGRALCAWAREIAAAARRGAHARRGTVSLIVNRRIDVALAIGADGVHLGFDALAVDDARALLEQFAPAGGRAIGCSLHAADEVDAAFARGATYVHLAPIWAPLSKPVAHAALGTRALAEASTRTIPVLAQGGVTPERCREAIAAGAAGVAVTGAILLAADPAEASRALREALDRG